MMDPAEASALLASAGLDAWAEQLPAQLSRRLDRPHGDQARWQRAIEQLPSRATDYLRLDRSPIQLGHDADIDTADRAALHEHLQALHPWRKGPFRLYGMDLDTEWRSDWKWERVQPYIAPLKGRRILDVGCGNGYYAWRMLGEGAELVVGIDPTALFHAQFLALRKLFHCAQSSYRLERVLHLPLGIEDVPGGIAAFDTTFSMGVFYHRRSPIDHLLELRDTLRPGGELVLETLVIEGREDQVLLPPGRYAKMRNVWFIPSVAALELWLRRAGLQNVRTVDVTRTTPQEQRKSDWMRFESLSDFLDPADSSLTIEGHPAPCRAVLLANRSN